MPSSISSSNPRRPHQRGRAVLLWGLGAFVGLQLAASCLFDYTWPSVRFPSFYDQVARFEAEPAPPDVICLGSSRINSLLLENQIDVVVRDATGDATFHAFNACVPGGDIIVSERMFQCLIDRGARPRFLIVEVAPETVNHRAGWLLMYGPWFLRWHQVPAFFHDMIVTRSLLRFAGSRLLPIYYYRDQIRQQLSARIGAWCAGEHSAEQAAGDPDAKWYLGRLRRHASTRAAVAPSDGNTQWHRLIAEAARGAPNEPNSATSVGLDALKRGLRDYRPGGNAAAALERLLSNCQAHGVEPILVVIPAPSAHRACYTSEIEASFQAYMADTARKHSCRCADYHDALADNFFVDHHHASHAGGLLFTRRFSIEVLTPLWSAPAAD